MRETVGAILAVGPRELPDGPVKVWVDTGSGGGHVITVSACDLVVAELDDGQGTSAIYSLRNGEHVEQRPNWDCRACGRPWPCDPAREALAATLPPVALRTQMWTRLEVAIQDLPPSPASELFERFLRWTG